MEVDMSKVTNKPKSRAPGKKHDALMESLVKALNEHTKVTAKIAEYVDQNMRVLEAVQPTLVRVKAGAAVDGGVLPEAKYIFIGEIAQMPGHGVYVEVKTGQVLTTAHTNLFERVPDEEA